VHLPKPALLLGAKARFGGLSGLRVMGKRKMFVGEANLSPVFVSQPIQGNREVSAVGAFLADSTSFSRTTGGFGVTATASGGKSAGFLRRLLQSVHSFERVSEVKER
jgi:hypothetical protein